MSEPWAILDYGVGNLHSLAKALAAQGVEVDIVDDAAKLANAHVAVLPGVGAFGAVMDQLAPAREALRTRHARGRPILGICIGHQVLHERSEESPGVTGLDILAGPVRRLPADAGKVPHMGWNTLEGADDRVLAGVPTGSHVYYVHSFAAMPGPHTTATTTYGVPFAAVERQGATLGLQFHPEKSGAVGARILSNCVNYLESLA